MMVCGTKKTMKEDEQPKKLALGYLFKQKPVVERACKWVDVTRRVSQL